MTTMPAAGLARVVAARQRRAIGRSITPTCRVAVSVEESVTAQQTAAREQAAAEKWDVESRNPAGCGGSTSASGHPRNARRWTGPTIRRVPGAGTATGSCTPADNARVEAECDRDRRTRGGRNLARLRAVEGQDPDRAPDRLRHRLKGRDRIKEKIYGTINDFSRSPEQAVSLLPDAVRFTFQYRESRYTQGVWADIGRLEGHGFKLEKLKNFWSDDQYKGINSQWSDLIPARSSKFSFIPASASRPSNSHLPTNESGRGGLMTRLRSKITSSAPISSSRWCWKPSRRRSPPTYRFRPAPTSIPDYP